MTHENDTNELEQFFAAARNDMPALDSERVERLVSGVAVPQASRAPQARRSFAVLRGWLPALGGLGAATAIGVWIGVVVPTSTFLEDGLLTSSDPLILSSFYAGADPSNFLFEEAGS